MKSLIKTTAVITVILSSALFSYAQVPLPIPPPTPLNVPAVASPPQGLTGRPGEGRQAENKLQKLTALNGKVSAYDANDRYEYDGIALQAGNNTIRVRFPAHMGTQLMKAAPKGALITVNGFYENSPLGVNEFHMVNATIGSSVISDSPPVIPVNPPVEQKHTFSGAISDFRRGPDGTVNGIILSGKDVVELPPPAAGQLQDLLTTGTKISGTGFIATPPEGVVMAQNYEVIHPQTLTLNGQTYLVR